MTLKYANLITNGSLFAGKLVLDQIALACRHDDDVEVIKKQLGLLDARWIEDEVLASGEVNGLPGDNVARLLFNYDYGIEIEILQYLEGPNYVENQQIDSGEICHLGFHANEPCHVPFGGLRVAQRVETLQHTNPAVLAANRSYRYTIFDARSILGTNLKVIERITKGEVA